MLGVIRRNQSRSGASPSRTVSPGNAGSHTSAVSTDGAQRVAAGFSAAPLDRGRKMHRLNILLASKTDNPYVTQGSSTNRLPAEPPRDEPYACFLQRRDEISAWLRSGYSVKGVWAACRRATPPFQGSYQTFWRYCRMHGLSVPRGTRPATPPQSASGAGQAPETPVGPGPTPKIWPRLAGKPREFIPRTED